MPTAHFLDWSNLFFFEYFLPSILHKENFLFSTDLVVIENPAWLSSWSLPLVLLGDTAWVLGLWTLSLPLPTVCWIAQPPGKLASLGLTLRTCLFGFLWK